MRKILFMALAVLIAAGCAESEKGTLCVKIAPAIRTRVTGLHFDTGDRIGLTISKGSAPYAENVPMTYDGTAFTASGLSWYNDLNEKSVLTAYYPYAEGGRPDEFTVSSDQTQGNGPSDLLAAVKTDVTPVSAPVGMIFYHVMSQLTIVVSNSSSAVVTGVSVGGLVPTAEIDYSMPKAAAKSGVAAAEVKACEVKPGATYRAILAPQQAALTVTVTTDDGRSHTKTLSSAQLESGRRYDMSVLVTNEEIQISLSGDIGDWEDGGSLDGSGGGDDGDDSQTLSYGGVTYRTTDCRGDGLDGREPALCARRSVADEGHLVSRRQRRCGVRPRTRHAVQLYCGAGRRTGRFRRSGSGNLPGGLACTLYRRTANAGRGSRLRIYARRHVEFRFKELCLVG